MPREQSKPIERLSAQQVLRLSVPLCRLVTGQSEPLTMTAEPVQVQESHSWNVLCEDRADREVVNLAWDADTGELAYMSVTGHSHKRAAGPLLSAKEANAIGHDWLRALSSGIPSGHWRPVQSKICNRQENWYLEYATTDRHAIVSVESHTGALKYAKVEVNRSGRKGR